MPLRIRPGTPQDAERMAEILGPIVARGGLTAVQGPVTAATFAPLWASETPVIVNFCVSDGELFGFQWVETHPALPPDTGDVATFVALDAHRRGVGRALFEATRPAARAAGWRALNATVLATNAGGLAYYRRMGFREVERDAARISHRLALD